VHVILPSYLMTKNTTVAGGDPIVVACYHPVLSVPSYKCHPTVSDYFKIIKFSIYSEGLDADDNPVEVSNPVMSAGDKESNTAIAA
jgi:hypothetical protein